MTRDLVVLVPFDGHAIGDTIAVDTDSKGTPTEFVWRRRLKQSVCEKAPPAPKPIKKKTLKAPADRSSE